MHVCNGDPDIVGVVRVGLFEVIASTFKRAIHEPVKSLDSRASTLDVSSILKSEVPSLYSLEVGIPYRYRGRGTVFKPSDN